MIPPFICLFFMCNMDQLYWFAHNCLGLSTENPASWENPQSWTNKAIPAQHVFFGEKISISLTLPRFVFFFLRGQGLF